MNYRMIKPILASILLLAIASIVWSRGEEGRPQIEAKLNIEVPDTIELNEPFQVAFTLETLEELYVDLNKPNSAGIGSPENAVFLGGDTLWTGHLQVGQPITLIATYKITEPKGCRFTGGLKTMGPQAPTEYLRNADGSIYRLEHINGIGSRYIKFPDYEKPATIPLITVTDSGTVISNVPMDVDMRILLDSPRVVKVVEEGGTLPQKAPPFNTDELFKNDKYTAVAKAPDTTTSEDSLRRIIVRPLPITLNPYLADTLTLLVLRNREYEFITDQKEDEVSMELISGDASYERRSGRVGAFELQSDSAIFHLRIGDYNKVIISK